MLSLRELRRAVAALDARLAGARLRKIVQPGPCEIVLVFAGRAGAGSGGAIVLSCRPGSARVAASGTAPPAPPTPPAFAQLLRARLAGARFVAARIVDGDRQAALRFESRAGGSELLLSILGPRSNLYLLDSEGVVQGALRPFETTRRDLARGAPWRSPASAPPPEGEDRFVAQPEAQLLEAIELEGRERERGERATELARRLDRALRREAARVARKAEQLGRELPAPGATEQARLEGELLKGVLHELRPGQEEVRLRRWDTQQELTVRLDPSLSPRRNLELCFERFRKARRREERVARELVALRARAEELESLARSLAALDAETEPVRREESLRRLAGHAVAGEALARHAPAPAARPVPAAGRRSAPRGAPARLRPLRYRTRDGLEVWVGRSAEGNDHLTLRLARGNDLFVHVEDSPGSHVVLRSQGRAQAPEESLLEACELAVHHSKLRRAVSATVHVTAVKNVRKPAGARAGLVHVLRGRSFTLRRDPARLARILAARLDGDGSAPPAPETGL